MDRSRLEELPSELIALIVKCLHTQSDLAALCRTCQILKELATKRLYKTVWLRRGKAESFSKTIGQKEAYAPFVRHLSIDYNQSLDDRRGRKWDLSPCNLAPCIENFHNLRSLHVCGVYWHWDDIRVDWGRDQTRIEDVLERTSLQHPAENRILQNLHSLTIDFQERDNQGWFMNGFEAVFLIQPLRELTLRGVRMVNRDRDIQPQSRQRRRQTELKVLRIEWTFIDILALKDILAIPKALTRLFLSHKYNHAMPRDSDETFGTSRDLCDALAQQRESLEELEIPSALTRPDEPLDDADDSIDLSGFPALRRYFGIYTDSSKRFVPAGDVYGEDIYPFIENRTGVTFSDWYRSISAQV